MFCINCGKILPDSARFCPACGNPVSTVKQPPWQKRICPGCGNEVEDGLMFCNKCGTKMDIVHPQSASQQDLALKQARDQLLQTLKNSQPQNGGAADRPILERVERPRPVKVSLYTGDSKLGVAKATGILNVYADHLEFHKTMGSSGAVAFGLIGMAVSSSKAKKESPVIFEMSNISGARNSKYMGAFPAMVLEMKNGEKYTFAGTAVGEDLKKCVAFITRNIQ